MTVDGEVHPNITFKDFPTDEYWEGTKADGTASIGQIQGTISGALTRRFIDSSVGLSTECSKVSVGYLDGGTKNAVAQVDGQGFNPFILMVSLGTPGLNDNTVSDYQGLNLLYQEALRRGIKPFVARPLALTTFNGVPAFSVELLGEHVAVNTRVASFFIDAPIQVFLDRPEVFLSTDLPKGADFNSLQLNAKAALLRRLLITEDIKKGSLDEIFGKSEWLRPTNEMLTAIVSRLYLIHRLTNGCLPAEFSIIAGDFMVNPDVPGYDPMLTTIRGGLRNIGRLSFEQYMYALESLLYLTQTELQVQHVFTPGIVREGVAIGRGILRQAQHP